MVNFFKLVRRNVGLGDLFEFYFNNLLELVNVVVKREGDFKFSEMLYFCLKMEVLVN